MSKDETRLIRGLAFVAFLGFLAYQMDYGPTVVQSFKTPIWVLFWIVVIVIWILDALPKRLSGRLRTPGDIPESSVGRLFSNDAVLRNSIIGWFIALYAARFVVADDPYDFDIGAFGVYLCLMPPYVLYLWRSNTFRDRESTR